MNAANIDEVIAHLDTIVEETRGREDPLAYFAAMYREVTRRIKDGIHTGRFDDGPRMDRVDTAFANYYLRAYAAHRDGGTVSAPWRLAFDFARGSKSGIFQHLLLGMNAHINFDLAQAVADEEAGNLPVFKDDYDRINDILFELLGPLQDTVAVYIWGAPLVDCMLGRLDESFAGWEMAKARSHAWVHAVELAGAPPADKDAILVHMDRFSVDLGRRLLVPRWNGAAAIWWTARQLEHGSVPSVVSAIEALALPGGGGG